MAPPKPVPLSLCCSGNISPYKTMGIELQPKLAKMKKTQIIEGTSQGLKIVTYSLEIKNMISYKVESIAADMIPLKNSRVLRPISLITILDIKELDNIIRSTAMT